MQFAKIFLLSLALVMLDHRCATAAPGSVFTSSSRCDNQQQQSCSPLSYVASKAMGALVKCASFACQWLPLPDFIKPSKPTLTMGKPSNFCMKDASHFSSFENFD